MILTWESFSITKLKPPSTETLLLLPLQSLKAKQQNTQKEKETPRGWSVWILIFSLSEALCLMHLMKWGKPAVNSPVILSVLSGMCLELLDSISYTYLFLKPSFSSFWNSSLNVMLTIFYPSNHDHGSSVLSACSVSFNTADGMAFKQNSKKTSTHMERDSSNEAASSPVQHRDLEPVNIFLHFKKKSKCKLLDSDQPTMLPFPSWEFFIITVLT